MHIAYVTYNKIDKKKWDACINGADNGLVYATSTYLDCMAQTWDALIVNDYELVMPLPTRKKFGINYLYQPSITPALGVFGKNVTQEIVQTFINAIPARFKLWDISFNSSNTFDYNRGVIIKRKNYVLNLNDSYQNIQASYSENIHRNISKSLRNGCILKKDISFDDIAAICKQEFPKFTNVEERLFENLHAVFNAYKTSSQTYGIYSKEGSLVASCVFLFFKNRAIYWLVGNTPESKQYGASAMLIDCFIKEHAGRNLLLDFEGSDVDSVADFYRKFGAVPEEYTTIFLNKLPFPFKLLKPLPSSYQLLISK